MKITTEILFTGIAIGLLAYHLIAYPLIAKKFEQIKKPFVGNG